MKRVKLRGLRRDAAVVLGDIGTMKDADVLTRAVDNLEPLLRECAAWVLERPRVHLHFTPASASWLNLVECWFSLLQRRTLTRTAFGSTDALEAALRDYIAATNVAPKPFVWTKIADEILASVTRCCRRTSGANH